MLPFYYIRNFKDDKRNQPTSVHQQQQQYIVATSIPLHKLQTINNSGKYLFILE